MTNELALFAGAGGGILAGKLLGWRTVCAVEADRFAASVLVARQNDGTLEPFPIWSDVCTFDGEPWKGRIDVISGGFPCQDISTAGAGDGLKGSRSGLWEHFKRIIGEVCPAAVFVENAPTLTARGLSTVLWDLASLGYDAEWGVLGASAIGAPHKRERFWLMAHARGQSPQRHRVPKEFYEKAGRVPGSGEVQLSPAGGCGQNGAGGREAAGELGRSGLVREAPAQVGREGWWESEPGVGRLAHGVANWFLRLRCSGNGQVPAVATRAWQILTDRMAEHDNS